jgi:hypothetical protein
MRKARELAMKFADASGIGPLDHTTFQRALRLD